MVTITTYKDDPVPLTHSHCKDELKIFDEGSSVDIEFTFSQNESRKEKYVLIFCSPSLDPCAAEQMHEMIGHHLSKLHVQIISFVNKEHLYGENPFNKPPTAINLTFCELNYLYDTLAEIILSVAKLQNIDLLYFAAENERLLPIYDRYVKKITERNKLTYEKSGAGYAIQTRCT